MPTFDLCLSLQFERHDPVVQAHRPCLPRHRVLRWLRQALQGPAELTVRMVGEKQGKSLNHQFRERDYATNVLTFDYSHAPLIHADIVICAPVVEKEAAELGIELQAHYVHLIVHGALHAQGYDHETESKAQTMETLESQIMANLGFADPYALK